MRRNQIIMLVAAVTSAGIVARGEEPKHQKLWDQATENLRDAIEMKFDVSALSAGDNRLAGVMGDRLVATRVIAARELMKDKEADAALSFLYSCLIDRSLRSNWYAPELLVEFTQRDPSAALRALHVILTDFTPRHFAAVAALWKQDPKLIDIVLADAITKRKVDLLTLLNRSVAGNPELWPKERIRAMLKSEDSEIRLIGADVSAMNGDASAVAVLAALIGDERDPPRDLFHAMRCLGHLYEKGGREALIKLLQDKRDYGDTTIADMARSQIIEHAINDDVELLNRFCQNGKVRFDALQALLRLSPQAAKTWLDHGESDPDMSVRVLVAGARAKAGDEKAIAQLEKWCYEPLGLGGAPAINLVRANNPKAWTAFFEMLKVASEKGDEVKHYWSRSNAGDALHLTEELVPVLKDVLASANQEQLQPMWSAMALRKGALTKIAPMIEAALEHEKFRQVIEAVANADLSSDAEKKLATGYLTACLETDAAMKAARVGRDRKLLTDEAIRTAAKEALKEIRDPAVAMEYIEMLGEVGKEEDLDLLARGLSDKAATGADADAISFDQRLTQVARAIAVRQVISRIPK